LEVSVIFDQENNRPWIIRSLDDHPIFGPSTYDLVLKNYTQVDGILYPTRIQTILNNKHLIMDYEIGQILANPTFDAATFSGPEDLSGLQHPVSDSEYTFSEIAT
jgi:hypothetical protein